MNISPPSTCRWSSAATVLALAGVALAPQPPPKQTSGSELPPFLNEFQAGKARDLPLFLDEFHANRETPLIAKAVDFPSAVGHVYGFWARPERAQPLPAALLVYDDDGWTPWMKTNVRQLASIGYEVLAVNVQRRRLAATGAAFTDEPTLAELSAAVRWLRNRGDVLPNRLGVVGWGWSGGQALALAAAMSVQACVICDAPLPSEPGLIVGLRATPVLGVFGGELREMSAFRKLLARHQVSCKWHRVPEASPGFMGPPASKPYAHEAAEDAWVAIYNFLEKHVEDARPSAAAPVKSIATIADIMRAVNEPAGLRGALSRELAQEPATVRQWRHIRANAALVAEAGAWLQARPAPKGPAGHWQEQAQAYTDAAVTLVDAVDRRDFSAAKQALQRLASQCAACHNEHR